MKDKCYVVILKGELFPTIVRETRYFELQRLNAIDEEKVEWRNPLEYDEASRAVHEYICRRTCLYVVQNASNQVWIEPHIIGSMPESIKSGDAKTLAMFSIDLQNEAINVMEDVTNSRITSNKCLFVKNRSGNSWIELHEKGYLDVKHETKAIFPLNMQETAEKYVLKSADIIGADSKSLHVLYNPEKNESWIEVHEIGEIIADTIAIFPEELQENAENFVQEIISVKEAI